MEEPIYSLQVYEDYAVVRGSLTPAMLKVLIQLCRKHGFKYLTPNEGGGFKLVKKV